MANAFLPVPRYSGLRFMLAESRTIQILCVAVLLGLVCQAGGADRPARKLDPLHMAKAGLSGFLAAQSSDKPVILVAEAPCGDDACIHLGIEAASRHHFMRVLPQIAAGFGTGADVVELELASRGGNVAASSLRLLVRPGATAAPEELAERAGGLLEFLKILSALTPPEHVALSPRTTPPDKAVYFIYSITLEKSGRNLDAFLLAPPDAKPPVPRTPPSACVEGEIVAEGVNKKAPFARWKKYRVSWTHVCNREGKALQSDERAQENR